MSWDWNGYAGGNQWQKKKPSNYHKLVYQSAATGITKYQQKKTKSLPNGHFLKSLKYQTEVRIFTLWREEQEEKHCLLFLNLMRRP